MAEAFHRAGISTDIAWAVDIDEMALAVFKENFPFANCLVQDVNSVLSHLQAGSPRGGAPRPPQVDVLLGGPPCQGHSNLNNHTRRADPRNALYAVMGSAAHLLNAKVVIIENVSAVLHDRDGIVGQTRFSLEGAGYEVSDAVVDFSRIGVPQRRRRHLMVASRLKSIRPAAIFESLNSSDASKRSVRWAIGDLESAATKEGFDAASTASKINRQRIRWLFENGAYELPDRLRPDCHKLKSHSYKAIYGRLRWGEVANTITTGFGSMGQGRYVHPSRRRLITCHEAARLQGFPDFFSFGAVSQRSIWARMIGNAVPPMLTLRIGELIAQPLLSELQSFGVARASRK